MPSFNVLTDVIGGQDRASNKDTTLPYDIRAEIDWHDFACTANPLGAPERIKDAIASAIAEGAMTFRPDKAGVHLSNNLARYYEISPECFLVGTSPSALIADIAQAYRPCNVGIPTPAPTEYYLAVANVGHNPVKLMNAYSLSAVEPQVAVQNGVRFEAAVLGNPSFPCARLLSERTLDRYIDHCNWVIVDESSVTLTMGGDSFVTRAYKQENLIVIRNLSEELGMPGIPLSYAIGHPDTIKLIRQFTDGTSIGMFHEIVAQQLPYLGDYQERTNRSPGCNACSASSRAFACSHQKLTSSCARSKSVRRAISASLMQPIWSCACKQRASVCATLRAFQVSRRIVISWCAFARMKRTRSSSKRCAVSSSSAHINHARTSLNQRPESKSASLAQGAPLLCASLNL